MFLKYEAGSVTIIEEKPSNAKACDVWGIVDAHASELGDILVADLHKYIREEAVAIRDVAERMESEEELHTYLFGDGDFLEPLEGEFGILLSDYPELRDYQLQQFEDIEEKLR